MENKKTCIEVFVECASARDNGILIKRESAKDKEFHFQNWFEGRLKKLKLKYDPPARNSYPDFRLVQFPEGYEVKGLATPGRELNFDSNSQVPTGYHNGRSIFYLFGRYQKETKAKQYPVIDLVLCHGDFLNCDHEYVHENKSVRGFGSYGDIMIRDRKMYVAPTPFALASGTAGFATLILPDGYPVDKRLQPVGNITRKEADELITAYSFDLRTNSLRPTKVPNPNKGVEHHFKAYRIKGGPKASVALVSPTQIAEALKESEE